MTLDEYGRGGWDWLVEAYFASPVGRSFLVLEDGVIVARCGYQRLPQPGEPCPGARLVSLAAASASIAGEFLSACLAGRRPKGLLPCRGKPGRWIRYLTGIRPPEPSDAETAAIVLTIEERFKLPGAAPDHTILSDSAWQTIAISLHITARQLQVLQGVFDDRTDWAIGRLLGISRDTVHTHVQRLYERFGVRSRSQLILRVLAEHLHGQS